MFAGFYPSGRSVIEPYGVADETECLELCQKRRAVFQHCYGATFDYYTGQCRIHTSKCSFCPTYLLLLSTLVVSTQLFLLSIFPNGKSGCCLGLDNTGGLKGLSPIETTPRKFSNPMQLSTRAGLAPKGQVSNFWVWTPWPKLLDLGAVLILNGALNQTRVLSVLNQTQYRWVPLYPNMLKLKLVKKLKYSQNHISIPAVLFCPHNSKFPWKNFTWYYFFRIKQDVSVGERWASHIFCAKCMSSRDL